MDLLLFHKALALACVKLIRPFDERHLLATEKSDVVESKAGLGSREV